MGRNLPVAKIVLISKCDPFWITNPSVEQPANPYRLLQHFVALLAAFDLFASQQHFPMPLNSADSAVHWNPPKRVNSLNMPWLIKRHRKPKRNVVRLKSHHRRCVFFAGDKCLIFFSVCMVCIFDCRQNPSFLTVAFKCHSNRVYLRIWSIDQYSFSFKLLILWYFSL